MTNKSITNLTAASVPLVGTETLPVFQGGTTVKITRDELFTPAAAKGINFTANTPAAGMTSQLLNWYEEGTWTPNQGAGLTVVGAFSSSGKYTRIGRQVTVIGVLNGATSISVGAGYATMCSNLPFNGSSTGTGVMYNNAATAMGVVFNGGAILYSGTVMAATTVLAFSLTYFI